MGSLLRDRRGASAFVTVLALTPMIGSVAIGAEGASWYITQRHAQNAADAAAYAGALVLACQIGAGDTQGLSHACPPQDAHTITYRAGEFAAKNGFCDTTDTGYTCTTSLTQTVTVSMPTTSRVEAIATQTQPAQLAAILLGNGTNVTIGAHAIAQVQNLTAPPCILATQGSVSFQGSPTVNSPNCGDASDSTASNAIAFTGNATDVNAPSYTVGGCSETGGTQCNHNVTTHGLAPVPDPLKGLNSAMASLTPSSFPSGQCSGLKSFGTGSCYNGATTLNGVLNGTYYFNNTVTITGSAVISGTATIVLFGSNASLKITGNPSIQLTAEQTPAVPSALSSVQNLMSDLLIYDPESFTNPNKSVFVGGNSSSYFKGVVYVPNAPITYSGNSTINVNSTSSCIEVIAQAVTIAGNSNFDDSACPTAVTPKVLYVALVQ
jgi:Flp pilus assembly protein TadG